MNRKQLALLVVVLVILGGAGILIQNNRNNSSESGEAGAGKKLLGDKFPINDVAHIVVKGDTNELNLVKQDDVWRVKERSGYPASFAQISELLIKAAELKVIQSEEIGASQLARMQLAAAGQGTNSGTILDLKGKDDKSIKSVLMGKKHFRKMPAEQMGRFGDEGAADGRYVMTEGDKGHVLLVGDALNNVEPKPESWLSKEFFRVEKPKTISVTYSSAATNSWELTRESESGEWKLTDLKKDEKLDTAKVSGVTSPFGSPMFDDVLAAAVKAEDIGLDKPTVVTVTTFDNLTYTVKVGKKSGEDYPIAMSVTANFPKERPPGKDEKPEEKDKADKAWKEQQKHLDDKLKLEKSFEKWVYLLPAWNADPILKERKDLLVNKADEAKKDDKTAATEEKKDDLGPVDPLTTAPPDKKP